MTESPNHKRPSRWAPYDRPRVPPQPKRTTPAETCLPEPAAAGVLAIYHAPRFGAPKPNEVTIRIERTTVSAERATLAPAAAGVIIHVTAPDPDTAERVVSELFGPGQSMSIELCG